MSGAARAPLEAAPPSEHPRGPLWHWELWTSTWPWARGRNRKIPSNHPTLISPYFIENKLLHKSLDRTQNDMLICSFHLRSSQPYLINSYRIFSQNHTNKNNFMKLFGLRYRFVRHGAGGVDSQILRDLLWAAAAFARLVNDCKVFFFCFWFVSWFEKRFNQSW